MIQTSVVVNTKNTPKMIRSAIDGNESAIINVLTRIVARAKRLAPVDTGLLRASTQWTTSTREGGFQSTQQNGKVSKKYETRLKSGEGVFSNTAEYAAYQEYGTRYQNAQPFMVPAITSELEGAKVQSTVKYEINTRAQKAGL